MFAAIEEFFASGQPVLTEAVGPSDTEIHEDDDEVLTAHLSMPAVFVDTRLCVTVGCYHQRVVRHENPASGP